MDDPERRAATRPGAIARAVAGAWHVAAAIAFLARTPAVRLPALACAVVTFMFLSAGAASGIYLLQYVENVVIPAPGAVGETLGVLVPFLLGLGALGSGTFIGLALALLVCTPLLLKVSVAAERAVMGDAARGTEGDAAQAFKTSALLLVGAAPVLLLSMLPLVGPFLASLLAAALLAVQQTDVPLARRGLDFAQRIAWHRRYLPESLGFGAAALVLLLVPCAGFLVTSALAAGGTFVVLEFEEGLSVPEPAGTLPLEP